MHYFFYFLVSRGEKPSRVKHDVARQLCPDTPKFDGYEFARILREKGSYTTVYYSLAYPR